MCLDPFASRGAHPVASQVRAGPGGAEGTGAGEIDEIPVGEHAVPHRRRSQEDQAALDGHAEGDHSVGAGNGAVGLYVDGDVYFG